MTMRSRAMSWRTLATALTASGFAMLGSCASQPGMINRPGPAILAAARQGNPIAEYQVGLAAIQHAHSARERANGLAWIRHAADQNLTMAQDYMGEAYLQGHGVPQNTVVALKWLHRAAERGGPAAQLQLGNLYESGDIVRVDDARAYFWFAVAAKPVRSDVTIYNIAQVRAIAEKDLSRVSAGLTPAQRESIMQRVAAWQPKPSAPFNGNVQLNARGA